ncbi:hypothetical protein PPL_00417 [Heterostelium album PN500]|uniref:Uncharacterized protein n=1 Tax=Heterostelium pallidum (strain ATCC 26659 / Pp 5 / PN500) TaxID=670386 RepID=D3AWE3_HETP5|nr:hypothetical protein PPL_00417 [Heterostelium album PN500]EFA86616.1 hypothetical protein PPL_00417 [Heterostelium album PN500]|eukprot:XP_020438721.1 hypothetical protein PPL_00417 [Heterostelium album PN500]
MGVQMPPMMYFGAPGYVPTHMPAYPYVPQAQKHQRQNKNRSYSHSHYPYQNTYPNGALDTVVDMNQNNMMSSGSVITTTATLQPQPMYITQPLVYNQQRVPRKRSSSESNNSTKRSSNANGYYDKQHHYHHYSPSSHHNHSPSQQTDTNNSHNGQLNNQPFVPRFFTDLDKEMPELMKKYLGCDDAAYENRHQKSSIYPTLKEYLKDFSLHNEERKKQIDKSQKTRWQEIAEKLFTISWQEFRENGFDSNKSSHRTELLKMRDKAISTGEKEMEQIISNYLYSG